MDNYQMQNNYQQPGGYQQPVIPEEYQPISMWGYFGYSLLFSVPCVGLVFLIVFALGGTKNINLKNWSRSYFCLMLIGLIIGIIFALLGGAAGMMSSMGY